MSDYSFGCRWWLCRNTLAPRANAAVQRVVSRVISHSRFWWHNRRRWVCPANTPARIHRLLRSCSAALLPMCTCCSLANQSHTHNSWPGSLTLAAWWSTVSSCWYLQAAPTQENHPRWHGAKLQAVIPMQYVTCQLAQHNANRITPVESKTQKQVQTRSLLTAHRRMRACCGCWRTRQTNQ